MKDKPVVLDQGSFSESQLEQLRQANKIWEVKDIYESQMSELAEIRFPGDISDRQAFIDASPKGDLAGAWVYYPWSGVLLHCVPEDELFELRTNRNKNLISQEEQTVLAASVVAVAGMSVGSGIVLSCVYSGISNTVKIADFDKLETANLNRLRESLPDIGVDKTVLAARHIYELNPFAKVIDFENGVNINNIDKFFTDPATSVVVDEIDDFKMKVQLRLKAKEQKVPLLMFTSLGDNILVDVERYDINKELEIFNGAVAGLSEEILAKTEISPEDAKKYAVQLVGPEFVPTKAIGSLPKIGKTLVGRPQLYSTIAVDGGLAAYIIKSILLGQPVKSGRYFIKFADLLQMNSSDLADSEERRNLLNGLLGASN